MTRDTRRSPILALLATAAIIFAACGGAASTAPSSEPTTTPTQGPTAEPFDGNVYPEDGSSACGTDGYNGQIGSIKALDAQTVEFTLCAPDAAFLSKIAFTSLGIQDEGYLEETGGGGEALFRNPMGTGPYQFKSWTAGTEISIEAYEDYWGTAPLTPNVVIRWSTESAQKLLELQSQQVDGIDNVGADDFPTIEGDSDLALFRRTALNTFYLGMNNTKPYWKNDKIRQAIAMGIDRQRIVDTFFPPGSITASHFTPCEIPGGCEGEEWYEFDPEGARELLAEGMAEENITEIVTKVSLREPPRCYLPAPLDIATDVQDQLQENLGITAEIDIIDTTVYLGIASRGELDGIFLLGWCADFPDVTNFLDTFFGVGQDDSLGTPWDDVTALLTEGGRTADLEERKAIYEQANDLIKEHVPMVPISHGGSATAFLADVEGAHSSPLNQEDFSVMKPGDRDQLVFVQNGEPGGLYCADETDGEALRICGQILESLYDYKVAGTEPIPNLATCEANADSTVWTCTLQEGITFHNGATLDANDVVTTYAVQWDAEHPLRVGREGLFEYWGYLFAGNLNPPPPTE
ncbi:MAG TPA: ABC transporter substrate-binding protein [Candidatus Limnocylindrales bacterium]|nr:ABC transporter substrate-binding protein [Candidatus Limnocylindrales bacterium]